MELIFTKILMRIKTFRRIQHTSKILQGMRATMIHNQVCKISQPKPTFPKPEECCGDSCPTCVWDLYFKELDIWKTKLNKWPINVKHDRLVHDVSNMSTTKNPDNYFIEYE